MQLAFVLIEPKVPENVGAAARALCTMGFAELWLVNSDQHTRPEAGWLAHGSQHLLDNARIFPDLAAVRNSVDLLIGTSAKPRHSRTDWHPPGSCVRSWSARARRWRQPHWSSAGKIAACPTTNWPCVTCSRAFP